MTNLKAWRAELPGRRSHSRRRRSGPERPTRPQTTDKRNQTQPCESYMGALSSRHYEFVSPCQRSLGKEPRRGDDRLL